MIAAARLAVGVANVAGGSPRRLLRPGDRLERLRPHGFLGGEVAGAHPLPALARRVARGRATLMGFLYADGFLGCA
ncbi:hypothetical protein [Pseudoclavibacter sp. 8L]|uniref:hypothetical protein n=1 Tax=Pseudoclavibacter sp. 8L TaxID=2653162 RepID=UPI001358E3A0|nr:hypothetical protein [Pseudoclavibacter sp. 8L]